MPVWLWLLVWIAIFAAGAAVYVLRPVWQHRGQAVSEDERTRSELLARREAVLTALRELDLDYAVGKVPERDYQTQRAALLREGAQILRALDEVEQRLASNPPEGAADERLEELLAQRRRARARTAWTEPIHAPEAATPTEAATETVEDVVEDLLLARRKVRGGRFVGFCPRCGAPYQAHDRFCGKCGQPLRDAPSHRKRRAKAKG